MASGNVAVRGGITMRRVGPGLAAVGWVGLTWACAGAQAHAQAQSAGTPLPDDPAPGRYVLTINSGGFERVAQVQVPKGRRPGSRPPLVLAFHGAGGSGEYMLDRDRWAEKADREGFIAVAPTGLPARPRQPANFQANPRLWNSGQLNPLSPRARVDDVAYVAALLDELQKRVPYDPAHVYVTGHSNGAGMAFRLGAELSERFAALAPVAGMMAVARPRPKKPLPTLYIIGTKDRLQPLEGGEVTLPWATRTNRPVSTYLTAWAEALGCSTEPKTLSDRDGLKRVEYPSRTGGPALQVIYIEGQGHNWPGGRGFLPERAVGPSTTKLDATDAIWTFFRTAGTGTAAAGH